MSEPAKAPATSVYMIGILGAGMSALARLYLERGWRVSGCDSAVNHRLNPLREAGARIHPDGDTRDLTSFDLVVHSPAIAFDHPAMQEARARRLPLMTRARALAELLADNRYISVLGSHGKTTTTAMLAFLLDRAGQEPGYMIGEACRALDRQNASWAGKGPFVVESCEAFRALDHWRPGHSIINGIDDEHSEHYGSLEELTAAFEDVLRRIPEGGRILLCAEDLRLQDMAATLQRPVTFFGTSAHADWRADIQALGAESAEFDLWRGGRFLAPVSLPLAGRHNVLNALAAIAMASEFGCAPAWSARTLAEFTALPRRWQQIGRHAGVTIYDDIAHHPTEVAATLENARRVVTAGGRVVAVFQPQSISRITRQVQAFATSLSAADQVVLLPLDTSGEPDIGTDIVEELRARLLGTGTAAQLATTLEEALEMVARRALPSDTVVSMGPSLAHAFATALPAMLGRRTRDAKEAASAPQAQAPIARVLHGRFEDMVRDRPDALCLIEGDRCWSYREMNDLAEKVAACLQGREMPGDALVVLAVEKSGWFLALLLGTLKAGCAFVPVDPAMRRPALNDLLHRVGAALVIEDAASASAPVTALPTLDLASFLEEVLQATITPDRPAPHPSTLAYGIFTSGSTGTPRLVGVSHENVTALLEHSLAHLFTPEDLGLTPFIDSISFDASVHQIFATLSSGGCLLLERDLPSLLGSERFEEVTNLGGTPSVIGALVADRRLPESLRVISLGGEVIPQGLIDRLRGNAKLEKIYNFYGPTETTIYSTAAELLNGTAGAQMAKAGTTIGRPVTGTTIRILGPDGNPVPDGEVGEITVYGKGVARGYLGEPVQTMIRFGTAPEGRFFRSGDLGRSLPDGSFEFLGRMDDQMKINGVRIDPVEIERRLEACPGVARAVVFLEHDEGDSAVLAALVVAEEGIDTGGLRRQVAADLPAVMVPRRIARVPDLPMTASGKLQRKGLASPEADMHGAPDEAASLDGVERRLLAIWRSVLGCPALHLEDNFFDAGGDSLASMQLVLMVEKAFGVRLPAHLLESLGTVATMADGIRQLVSNPACLTKARADVGARLLDRQRAYLAAWSDGETQQAGFIRSLDGKPGPVGLVWCCQGFNEFRALARELQGNLPVYGMRSGHLIMEYSPDTIQSLAMCYCDALLEWQPEGPFMLGGNCQGATIARATALALRARGREVSRLILMEQFTIWPYDQEVGLIFGRHSAHNPLLRDRDPTPLLNGAYPGGYDMRIIDGKHGRFFAPHNIKSLAAEVRALLAPRGATDQASVAISL